VPDVAEFNAPLRRSFFERPVRTVARQLLGCYLVHRRGRSLVGGRIVEVEAYGGPGDPGSHADRAPNGRARIMFGPAGMAYVYFTYGMHFCMNAVCGPEGRASAVLLRALEPVWGIDRMRDGAPPSLADTKLASGPGRICRALGVDRALNGADLTASTLRILPRRSTPGKIHETTRIGLSTDDERRWRFFVDSPSVSGSRRPRMSP
jgi:DNA-3-methyladenine glycosylase